MNPILVFNTLDTFFCYLGIKPTTFDAPVKSYSDMSGDLG